MTGSRFPILVGNNSSLPLSFGTPKQLGNGKLHGSPFENITMNRYTKKIIYIDNALLVRFVTTQTYARTHHERPQNESKRHNIYGNWLILLANCLIWFDSSSIDIWRAHVPFAYGFFLLILLLFFPLLLIHIDFAHIWDSNSLNRPFISRCVQTHK